MEGEGSAARCGEIWRLCLLEVEGEDEGGDDGAHDVDVRLASLDVPVLALMGEVCGATGVTKSTNWGLGRAAQSPPVRELVLLSVLLSGSTQVFRVTECSIDCCGSG